MKLVGIDDKESIDIAIDGADEVSDELNIKALETIEAFADSTELVVRSTNGNTINMPLNSI